MRCSLSAGGSSGVCMSPRECRREKFQCTRGESCPGNDDDDEVSCDSWGRSRGGVVVRLSWSPGSLVAASQKSTSTKKGIRAHAKPSWVGGFIGERCWLALSLSELPAYLCHVPTSSCPELKIRKIRRHHQFSTSPLLRVLQWYENYILEGANHFTSLFTRNAGI
jgi:hypothetical protein